MKTYYIIYEDLEHSDQMAVFVQAPSQSLAIKTLGEGVEVIEVLEFDEDEEFMYIDTEGGVIYGYNEEASEEDYEELFGE